MISSHLPSLLPPPESEIIWLVGDGVALRENPNGEANGEDGVALRANPNGNVIRILALGK